MNFLKMDEIKNNYLINFLLFLIPISFIAGNLIINLNIVLIIIASIYFYGKNLFQPKLIFFDKLLISIFIFSIFTSLINTIFFQNIENNNFSTQTLEKAFLFSRFLLFYFVLRYLIEKKIFNFKFFFISSAICSIFVSVDLFFQYFNGEDIFGLSTKSYKLSGPFGDEEIAGSYLQRFSIFSFFLFLIYFPELNKNKKYFIFLILIFLFFFSIFLTGNRMPAVLFTLYWILLFILEKKLRKFLIFFLSALLIFFYLTINFNTHINNIILNFYNVTMQSIEFLPVLISNENVSEFPNTYIKELYSGILAWQENYFMGGGINSFHYNCSKSIKACASHPHNYYLEVLSEKGLIGMMLWGAVFLYIIYVSIIKKYFLKSSINQNNLITPFAILFLVEVFPFKTTGSFFTTGNATYIFLIISVIIALSKNPNIIK